MAADFVWPSRVLVAATAKLILEPYNTSGGMSFNDSEQIIGNTPGRAKLLLKNIALRSSQQIKVWNALEGGLCGRLKTIDVPIFDYPRAPWPTVGGAKIYTYGSIPFSDGSLFSDGSGFTQPVIVASMVNDVAQGDTSATILVGYGAGLEAGQHFEPWGTGKVYRIWNVGDGVVSTAGTTYIVQFRLPCREDIPAGTVLNFDDPKLRCRLVADDGMALPDGLELWKFATASVEFREDL